MNKNFFFILLLGLTFSGCAHNYKFTGAPAIKQADDAAPSPLPSKSGEFQFVENAVSSSVRYPLVDALDTRRKPRSQDVNSADQVPASSWFTPRLGSDNFSPEELVKGPEVKGPPQKPYVIVKVKSEGNSPGFIIKDSRGLKYLIKFDRSEYPALESTVNLAVNRLFWGFGYNVPEDYLVHFSPEDANLGEGISQDDVDKIYIFSYADENGAYRAVASLFIEGAILGHIGQRGTRKGDVNDVIAHENRRTLRGLRMFSAWLGNSGFRSDNTLEVYQGEPGKGHTIHYLLDFGENLGVHGIEKDRTWDGFEHFFSFSDTAKTFLTLGIPVKKWEDTKLAPGDNFGNFEAELFEPDKWKETTQFLPIRSSQPDDDYWAAKIIASVTPEHLEALFEAAKHPDADYSKFVMDVLSKRREKIIAYAFGRVSPLEFSDLKNGQLVLRDFGMENGVRSSGYRVRFLNSKGKKISTSLNLPAGKTVAIDLPKNQDYVAVEVTAERNGKPAPRPAEFHIRGSKLAGVLH